MGAVYFPTGVAAAMRDLELVNVLSLFYLAKSWKIPLYLGGDWNRHIENDHGGDDIHIGPFTSTTPTIPKGFVFARTFANEDIYLYENDVFWTDARAHRSVSKTKCSHVSLSDHVVKRYKIDIGAGQEKTGARSLRKKLFKINARRIEETQKRQLDRGALRGDGCNAILNREAYSTLCKKEQRPDLFNKDVPCTVAASDRFNMEHKCRIQDEIIIGIEQKVTKF